MSACKVGHHEPQEGCHYCFRKVLRERDEAKTAALCCESHCARLILEADETRLHLSTVIDLLDMTRRERDTARADAEGGWQAARDFESERDTHKARYQSSLSRNAQLLRELDEAQAAAERHNQRCVELLEEKLNLGEKLRQVVPDRDRLQAANDELQRRVLNAEGHTGQLNGMVCDRNAQIYQLRQQIEDLQEKLDISVSNECVALVERDKYKQELATLQETVSRLQHDLATALSKRDEAEVRYERQCEGRLDAQAVANRLFALLISIKREEMDINEATDRAPARTWLGLQHKTENCS